MYVYQLGVVIWQRTIDVGVCTTKRVTNYKSYYYNAIT